MKAVPEDKWEIFIDALSKRGWKYVLLAKFGRETGLRVSDILKLKIMQIRPVFDALQTKTKTVKKCKLSESLISEIEKYKITSGLTKRDFFIPSTQSNRNKHLSRVQAYRVFKAAALEVGLNEVATHSMRKTYAKDLYRVTKDLGAVQRDLGHKYVETTLRYFLDITKLEID